MSDESTEVIEQKMVETRESLTQKVSALETQVVDTLQSASTTVNDMVHQVKSAAPGTIAGMKETISDVRESVTASLDVSHHTRERPWAMVGGAAALGFVTGMVLFRRSYGPTQKQSAAPVHFSSNSPSPSTATHPVKLPGWLEQIVDKLAGKVTEEVRKLGEVAVATASASLQQSVERALPTLLGSPSADKEPANRISDSGVNGFTPQQR